jgi:hypothetical protein
MGRREGGVGLFCLCSHCRLLIGKTFLVLHLLVCACRFAFQVCCLLPHLALIQLSWGAAPCVAIMGCGRAGVEARLQHGQPLGGVQRQRADPQGAAAPRWSAPRPRLLGPSPRFCFLSCRYRKLPCSSALCSCWPCAPHHTPKHAHPPRFHHDLRLRITTRSALFVRLCRAPVQSPGSLIRARVLVHVQTAHPYPLTLQRAFLNCCPFLVRDADANL